MFLLATWFGCSLGVVSGVFFVLRGAIRVVFFGGDLMFFTQVIGDGGVRFCIFLIRHPVMVFCCYQCSVWFGSGHVCCWGFCRLLSSRGTFG